MSATPFLPQTAADDVTWLDHYRAIEANIVKFEAQGLILPDDYSGKRVLDLGGSSGQLAVSLLERGAATALVLDIGLPEDVYRDTLGEVRELRASSMPVEQYADLFPASIDFVVAHSVTEHISHPASVFPAVKAVMAPGAVFFIAHDNYYQPSGAHDNYMLRVGPTGLYEYGGPRCWETEQKCTTSQVWRQDMEQQSPPTWSPESEAGLTPSDCNGCAFFKRTHPWSHLMWQSEFGSVFREPEFTTGLNKITPFQLMQFLVEAGFDIELCRRSDHNNEPPGELLGYPHYFSYQELKTLNVFIRAR